MRVLSIITKAIRVFLIAVLICCCNVDLALARGGCFLGKTKISTPSGDRYIADLHQGDRIIGYNFDTQQSEVEKLAKLKRSDLQITT
jgi:hypothetical protein